MHEAKTHWSPLVDRVEAGEEIVIGRSGKPVAKLVPYQPERPARRGLGAWKGRVWIADKHQLLTWSRQSSCTGRVAYRPVEMRVALSRRDALAEAQDSTRPGRFLSVPAASSSLSASSRASTSLWSSSDSGAMTVSR